MVAENILITGGCGFVGSHLVEHFLKHTDYQIKVMDRLSYSSNGYDRLRDIGCFDSKRVQKFSTDFTLALPEGVKQELGDVNYILHLGAETHVDNSIIDPMPFVMANVVGTAHILNYARGLKNLNKFIYFSTDEVFGPAKPNESFKEWDRYNCTNPYAATKAGGEELVLAYANTYKLPALITHTMNIYGERQHPEKFIPMCINKIMANETVMIHGYPDRKQAGSRFYIHARNVANAVHFILREGQAREKYNIVGEREVDNLELAKFIAGVLGKTLNYKLVDFHSSRPGHDLRYALDGAKLKDLGWSVPINFEKSLEKTIKWYLKPNNEKWLKS